MGHERTQHKRERKNIHGHNKVHREEKPRMSSDLYGVVNFLKKRNLPDPEKIIREYGVSELGIDEENAEVIAPHIQKDFKSFVKYVNSNF